jgi:hypothetical protein
VWLKLADVLQMRERSRVVFNNFKCSQETLCRNLRISALQFWNCALNNFFIVNFCWWLFVNNVYLAREYNLVKAACRSLYICRLSSQLIRNTLCVSYKNQSVNRAMRAVYFKIYTKLNRTLCGKMQRFLLLQKLVHVRYHCHLKRSSSWCYFVCVLLAVSMFS